MSKLPEPESESIEEFARLLSKQEGHSILKHTKLAAPILTVSSVETPPVETPPVDILNYTALFDTYAFNVIPKDKTPHHISAIGHAEEVPVTGDPTEAE
ncbi:MAG: hypothetical protein COA94_01655 [Rickettsiales bacterium]|nr:MAG: hypothetical protein COA94_01655 [Rickettsiales bacterium]